jgi:ABC-type molybdate transport system substrate-binding protein
MTQEIFDTLKDILTDLEALQVELTNQVDNVASSSSDLAQEIESDVAEPLNVAIDQLTEILESINRFDDVEYFSDPYGDERQD